VTSTILGKPTATDPAKQGQQQPQELQTTPENNDFLMSTGVDGVESTDGLE
jgi:hypothetical protein